MDEKSNEPGIASDSLDLVIVVMEKFTSRAPCGWYHRCSG